MSGTDARTDVRALQRTPSGMFGNDAVQSLMDGNARFVSGKPASRPLVSRVLRLAGGQSPFATVLACADSRVPVETLFDREPGDIFVVRLAGNFVSDAALASIEFATAVLKAPLVMVLGHTSCGAVKAALDYVHNDATFPGHIQLLAEALAPAARYARDRGDDAWYNAVAENVRLNVEKLRTSQPIMADALSRGDVEVVGAVYDLRTGRVELV